MGVVSTSDDKAFIGSLPGYSPITGDQEDMAVHSGFDYLKMEEGMVGTVEYTVPAYTSDQTYTIETVTHNYGYIPMCQCFVEDLDGALTTQYAILPLYDGWTISRFVCYTTTTQFVLQYIAVTAAPFASPQWDGLDFKFKYEIFIND
jgi:hypothetical protein